METIFFMVFLSCCALWDLRTGKVPNALILLGLTLFAAGVFIRGPSPGLSGETIPEELFLFLGRFVFSVMILFPLFLFRMMGAGDIKVMAVTTGYFGMESGFTIIFYGLAAAAVWSLFYMLRRHILVKRIIYFLSYFSKLFRTEQLLPYYCAGEHDESSFCFVPFLWCGFCIWMTANGGVL